MALLNILRMSLYQLLYLEKIPNYACLNEAVEITKQIYPLQNEPLTKFVNGVLNSLLRDIKSKKDFAPQMEDVNTQLSIKHSHPE